MGDSERPFADEHMPIDGEIPAPGVGGVPEPSLALERYLAESDAFVEVEDPASKKSFLMGNIPAYIKRRLYGLNGKHVINSYFTEKDLRVRKLKNFRSRVKEEMFTSPDELNKNNGRMLLDLDQAWIMQDDLQTQARGGSHSKQRTTITSVSMMGRVDNPTAKSSEQQGNSGGYW